MIESNVDTLRHTRAALAKFATEACLLAKEALNTPEFDFERAEMVMRRVRELKEEFVLGLSELYVRLDDGRRLMRPQLEALETFATHNSLPMNWLLSRITIEDALIVSANLNACGMTTTAGLAGIWSLRRLFLSNNPGLISLKHIPTDNIEELSAASCGLAGDLSELMNATKLRKIFIFENSGITSLQGLPLGNIEEIYAAECRLKGDLSELAAATMLKTLHVLKNQAITSLKGIQLKNIEHLYANGCGLTGDHTFLAEAPNLKTLVLLENPASLTLDASKFGVGTKLYV